MSLALTTQTRRQRAPRPETSQHEGGVIVDGDVPSAGQCVLFAGTRRHTGTGLLVGSRACANAARTP